eukprot:g5900.t1
MLTSISGVLLAALESLPKRVNVSDGTHHNMKDVKEELETSVVVRGWLFAAANVVCDVYGAILVKQHAHNLSTWTINFVRFGFASVALFLGLLVMSISKDFKLNFDEKTLKFMQLSREAWVRVFLGTVLATFMAPSISQYALFEIDLSLYSTLLALTPIYGVFLSQITGEKVTKKAWFGSILAFGGVAIMILL